MAARRALADDPARAGGEPTEGVRIIAAERARGGGRARRGRASVGARRGPASTTVPSAARRRPRRPCRFPLADIGRPVGRSSGPDRARRGPACRGSAARAAPPSRRPVDARRCDPSRPPSPRSTESRRPRPTPPRPTPIAPPSTSAAPRRRAAAEADDPPVLDLGRPAASSSCRTGPSRPPARCPQVVIGDVEADDDEDARWSSFASTGPRWRDEARATRSRRRPAWPTSIADDDEPEVERLGALDTSDRLSRRRLPELRRPRASTRSSESPDGRDHGARPTTADLDPARAGPSGPAHGARADARRRPAAGAPPTAGRRRRPPARRDRPGGGAGGAADAARAAAGGGGRDVPTGRGRRRGHRRRRPAPVQARARVRRWSSSCVVVVLGRRRVLRRRAARRVPPGDAARPRRRARALPLAAYWQGEAAYPARRCSSPSSSASLWYLLGVGPARSADRQPRRHRCSASCTIGVLGSFAALHARRPADEGVQHPARRHRRPPVAYDVGGFFVGRSVGRTPLVDGQPEQDRRGPGRRHASPPCVAVLIVAVLLGVGPFSVAARRSCSACSAPSPPRSATCAESLIKRDLGVKDMGTHPARPRRRARPLRRPAVRAAGRLLRRPRSWPRRLSRSESAPTGALGRAGAAAGRLGRLSRHDRDPGRPRRLDRLDRHPDARRRARPSPTASRSSPSAPRAPARRCSSPRPARSGPRSWPSPTTGRGRRAGRAAAPGARCGPAPTPWPAWPTEADVVVNGVVGFAGLPRHPGHARGRPAPGAGQQGVAHRRRPGGAAGPRARRAPSWCRSTASTAPSTSACGPPTTAGRVARLVLTASGGPVPGPHRAPSWPTVTVERRPGPPDLEHGPEDHGRLVDAHEQGPRGHRGPRAVRRRLRPTSTSSCTRSRSCTRWSSSPTAPPSPSSRMPDMRLPIGYALAYPDRIGTPVRPHRLGHARPPRLRAARPRRPSPASTWPTRPAARAAPPRRG